MCMSDGVTNHVGPEEHIPTVSFISIRRQQVVNGMLDSDLKGDEFLRNIIIPL